MRSCPGAAEMWRLTLSGFHSFDLSAIPAVRPGFVLKIIDTPASRMEPLGHRSRDALMPEGDTWSRVCFCAADTTPLLLCDPGCLGLGRCLGVRLAGLWVGGRRASQGAATHARTPASHRPPHVMHIQTYESRSKSGVGRIRTRRIPHPTHRCTPSSSISLPQATSWT